MKVILCGYHSAGAQVLAHLLERHDISDLAVLTHEPPAEVPDLRLPDLRALASRHRLWCSTESINRASLPFAPDIIASVYYRSIIQAHVIRSVGGRIFNLHPSLLPRHRGCSSIPWAILEGDTVTGVTFHYIDEGIDTGKIILQAAVPISSAETQASLFGRCIERGVEFWPAAFELVKAGFPGVPAEGPSSFHKRGAPYGGVIPEGWPVDRVERFIRAMIFPPYRLATFRGHEIGSLDDYLEVSGLAGPEQGGENRMRPAKGVHG
jgi:methionyl-tRNA formyltransferase